MDNWDSDFLDLVEEAVALHSDYDGLRLAVRLAPAGVWGGGLYGHSRIACSSLDPNQIGLATGTA